MSGVIDEGCCSCWFPSRMGLSYRGVVTLPVHSQNFPHVPEGRQWTCAPRSVCKAHLERQELSYVYMIEIPHLSWVSPLSGVADVPAAQDMFYQIFEYEYHDCLVDYMEGINYWTACKDLLKCKTQRKLKHLNKIKKNKLRIFSSSLYNLGVKSIVSYIIVFSNNKNTLNFIVIQQNWWESQRFVFSVVQFALLTKRKVCG